MPLFHSNTKRLLARKIEQASDIEAFIILVIFKTMRILREVGDWSENAIRFTPPSHKRTPQIIAEALTGMTIVLITALSTINISPGMLLAIPAYAIYVTIILVNRQNQINSLAA